MRSKFTKLIFGLPILEYWVDSASTITAPGGGILRIGYDQAEFEQAVRDVITDPKVKPIEEGEEKVKVDVEVVEEKVKVEIRKEDVTVIVSPSLQVDSNYV